MFQNLSIFKTAQAMAVHAGHRQALISRNIANADTPGYRAVDLPSFAENFDKSVAAGTMKATRSGHLNGATDRSAAHSVLERNSAGDPNGNSVSVEQEMMWAVDTKRQHDRALAIYRSSLNLLRGSLG